MIDVGKIREELKVEDEIKRNVKQRVLESYKNIKNLEEIVDILMIQIAKDVKQTFPGVNFRLFSRIKSEDSLNNKIDNILKTRSKEDMQDYIMKDIIGISVVVESVPNEVSVNDEDFDSRIQELINKREETKKTCEGYKEDSKNNDKTIANYKDRLKEAEHLILKNGEMIAKAETDKLSKEFVDYLNETQEYLSTNYKNLEKSLENRKREMETKNTIIQRSEERIMREDEDCKEIIADYIIKHLASFKNIKSLHVKDIKDELEIKRKYNGYTAVHNCLSINLTDSEGENIFIPFEVQGKTIEAYQESNRGKSSEYHVKQKVTSSVVKPKIKQIPEFLRIDDSNISESLKEERKEKLKKSLPVYRVYYTDKSKDEEGKVYKLSTKESFMLFYQNLLIGNETLGIENDKELLKIIVDKENHKNYLSIEDSDIYSL